MVLIPEQTFYHHFVQRSREQFSPHGLAGLAVRKIVNVGYLQTRLGLDFDTSIRACSHVRYRFYCASLRFNHTLYYRW